MEYTIGQIQRGNISSMILKIKSKEHTDFCGRITIEQKRGNIVIKDTCTILEKYKTIESSDGVIYDYYYIEDHYREEDRSEEIRAQLEQQITDLEIDVIEQDQSLTDHDIAIMELQETLDGLMAE